MIVKLKEIVDLHIDIDRILLLCNDSNGNTYITTTSDQKHCLTSQSFKALTEYLYHLDVNQESASETDSPIDLGGES